MKVEPVTLEGKRVLLEPLSFKHHTEMCEVGLDEDIWLLNPTPVRTSEDMRHYIAAALRDEQHELALPFATIEKESGRVVGSTRFANISREHYRVEIGWTWIGKTWQRSFVNTEVKYLMLSHAFENWKCIRVELKTDALNERSRNAILRIGAKEEGTFRNHMITASGRLRHTVYFSITNSEWPLVKVRLQEKLAAQYPQR
ncbi:MAG: GNAT family N-acetyltransferase [Acidobacteria bacterium]|nr:GNAT family N-acetyltransferase [Acidobacteriota bacterium]